MKQHKISWLNVPGYIPETYNPIVGCSKVSEGCRNCYAERMACRLASMATRERPNQYPLVVNYAASDGDGGWEGDACDRWNGKTVLVESALQKPLHWKKPRAIFVNSMGDLFHENTPDEWIDRVFAVMALCPHHLFIVLTKRAKRMEEYFSGVSNRKITVPAPLGKFLEMGLLDKNFPLPNVWLGVTAENQAAADERIPHLQNTPAAVRFVSCEPLIGPVDLMYSAFNGTDSFSTMYGIDWIIFGGESGPGARPMNPEWARSLRDQAQSAGVPFFFKQWGDEPWDEFVVPDGYSIKKHGGDILDGRQWHQWPEDVK